MSKTLYRIRLFHAVPTCTLQRDVSKHEHGLAFAKCRGPRRGGYRNARLTVAG
jgi:hypothetical protein